jgi:spore coat protein H
MQRWRIILFLLVVVATLALPAFDAHAAYGKSPKKKSPPGAEIFDNKTVLDIRIELAPSEWQALQRENRKYVRATVHEGGHTWRDVGVHLKGAAGSFRGLDDRPALTLKFDKFTPDLKFHGLRKIHLNNSVQDGSYLTENICGEVFRNAGIPAARVSYASVELNGRKRGLYVLKEGFAKEFLAMYFENTKGNLYDGGFLRDITEQLERDMGGEEDVRDWSDLKALAKAAQEPDDQKRWAALQQVLDTDRFLSYAALEVMMWDWDGYILNRNNYRVYHDLDTGKMIFLPHGMDQMFWEPTRPILPLDKINSSLVGGAVWRTPEGKKLYRERFGLLFTNVFQIEVLTNRINEIAALLTPAYTNWKGAGALGEYQGQVRRMHDLVTARHRHLAKLLSQPPPLPLEFTDGVARLKTWEVPAEPKDPANAVRDRVNFDGRPTLHIATTTNTAASWRTTVLLRQGTYRFEALARAANVVSQVNTNKGAGAGIRHSGIRTPRANKVEGTTAWSPLVYEFAVPTEEEDVTLLCELRASKGEAWFDLESLRLVKVK